MIWVSRVYTGRVILVGYWYFSEIAITPSAITVSGPTILTLINGPLFGPTDRLMADYKIGIISFPFMYHAWASFGSGVVQGLKTTKLKLVIQNLLIVAVVSTQLKASGLQKPTMRSQHLLTLSLACTGLLLTRQWHGV